MQDGSLLHVKNGPCTGLLSSASSSLGQVGLTGQVRRITSKRNIWTGSSGSVIPALW